MTRNRNRRQHNHAKRFTVVCVPGRTEADSVYSVYDLHRMTTHSSHGSDGIAARCFCVEANRKRNA